MQTYTMLYWRGGEGLGVQAVSFRAANAGQAVLLARQFAIEDRCELWTEGRFVCSLRMVLRRARQWMVASHEVATGVAIRLEAGS